MRALAPTLAAACITLAVPLPATVSEPVEDDSTKSVLTETVTVTSTRLADEPDDVTRVPASVTVIDREQIDRAGAVDLAELLALTAGAVLYDQTGNGVQTTFDMRGFTGGSGTRVFLDGVPLNDAINNTLALELVPIDALDRIEITRGSAAALAGGGAEAGVIHLITRREQELGGALRMAAGTFDTSEFGGHLSQTAGRWDFVLSGTERDSDGFRDNADGDLQRLSANVGFDLGNDRRLGLTLVASESDYGNPGALTSEELEQDRSASPFNSLDFAEETLDLATLNFRGPVATNLTLAANLFARDREVSSLTTGRAADQFGGFALESDAGFVGSTVQLAHRLEANVLTVGGEWLDGDTDSAGFSTPADDPGAIPAAPTTRTTSDRNTYGFFAQNTWNPTGSWTLMAGARYDSDRIELDETLPAAANDSRRFSELSLRGGATWNPHERLALYASYGEGFLPPTSEELFAFPGFGSNPTLDPEDSRSYEFGFRRRWPDRLSLDVNVFRIDTEDEIVFDPFSDEGLFGANVNAGEARREGVELSLRGRIASRARVFAELTLTDAEFRAGDDDGNTVPLVPRERLAAGFDLDLPAGLALRADALYVGEQTLDNDDANAQPDLDDYTVVNTRVRWKLAAITSPRNGLELFVEARNVFDEDYSTRGIYAFDFSTNLNDVFFTPAPGRRYLVGAEWVF